MKLARLFTFDDGDTHGRERKPDVLNVAGSMRLSFAGVTLCAL